MTESEFKRGNLVIFKRSSEFRANNLRGPFRVVSVTDYWISIEILRDEEPGQIVFLRGTSDSTQWHVGHFQPFYLRSRKKVNKKVSKVAA